MSENTEGLLRGYDIGELRRKIRQEPFAPIFDEMAGRVREAAERDAAETSLSAFGWCHSLYFTPMVLEAGFVHLMTGDPLAARHVARQIDKLARVYEDPPRSFFREIPSLPPGSRPSAYFSNAHTCLAARMCRDGIGEEHHARLATLARRRLIDDHHDEYFLTHFNAGHNAVVTHMVSGALCALALGRECGHPDFERVIRLGRDACELCLHWSFDEAGVPFEGPMYALVTLEWVFLFAELLRRHGGEDLFATLPKMAAVAQAAAELQLPGLVGVSSFQDCRRLITSHPMPWLLLTAKRYDRPRDLALWWQTRAPTDTSLPHHAHRGDWRGLLDLLWWDGAAPDKRLQDMGLPTAFAGRGAAVAVCRSSWSDEATCLVALGQGRSHNVPDHTHADAGHFSIHAHGDYLAYDTAYFNFDEDAHSVVLIDGTPHFRATHGNLYHGTFRTVNRHPLLDHIGVDAAAAKGCMWAERHILFVRGAGEGDPAYVVILDNINRDNGVHTFAWQLQANLHCRIETAGVEARVVGAKARLDCRFFNPLPVDYPTCPHRLRVFADDHVHKAPATGQPETNPRLVAEQTGPNCTLMSIVVPRRLDEPALAITDATVARTFNAYVEHGDFVDQVVFACDHTYVRLPDLNASSEVVVVRRSRTGGVVAVWTIDGNTARPGRASGKR